MPGNNLVAATALDAVRSAHNRGNALVRLSLMNGDTYAFVIEVVGGDFLIGHRPETPNNETLVPMHAVASLEFTR